MKYFSSSAFNLSVIRNLITLATIAGLFYFPISWSAIGIFFLFYFLYSGIGVGLMLLRYWTHRSFEFRSPIVKWIFTWFALMSIRGSVIGWVYVHREHHRYADTVEDPHSPKYKKWRIFFPYQMEYGQKINKFIVRDLLNETQIHFSKYYVLYVILWAAALCLISPWLLFYAWILPVFVTQIVVNFFTYFGHVIGYRTFDVKDDSKNSWFISLIFWGEGWHNNHHKYPSKPTTKIQWWEIDPLAWVIRIVRK